MKTIVIPKQKENKNTMKIESKETIYIRTYGNTMGVVIPFTTKENIVKYYDLDNMDEDKKANFRTILKIHKNTPINLMYEDFKRIRRWFQK